MNLKVGVCQGRSRFEPKKIRQRLIQPKKVFQGPVKAAVCIFDFNGADIFDRCRGESPPSTIYTRDEKLHLNLLTLFWWLAYSLQRKSTMIAYLQALIKQIQPKVALTLIDNDSKFYGLANVFPKISFIAVQNGWRYPYPIPIHAPARKTRAIYLGIGQNDLDGNSTVGLVFKHQEPIGSLKASVMSVRENATSHTICLPLSTHPSSWLRYLSFTSKEVKTLAQKVTDQLSSGSEQVCGWSNHNLESVMAWHELNAWMLLEILNEFIGLYPTKSVCRHETGIK